MSGGSLPPRRHSSRRKGLEKPREPGTGCVSVPGPPRTQGHLPLLLMPQIHRSTRPQQSQQSSNGLWKKTFLAHTSTGNASCSCILMEIDLQVDVGEQTFVSCFLCKPLSSQVLLYTKNGVIASIWHFLAAAFSSLGKDAQTTNESSKLYLELTKQFGTERNLSRDKALSTESVPNHKVLHQLYKTKLATSDLWH